MIKEGKIALSEELPGPNPAGVISRSAQETEDLGYKLGIFLKNQEKIKTVLLYGDLGAGKTTMVKGIAGAFSIPKAVVCSASFVIVAEYESSPRFYHIDLYRLEGADDIEAAGVWEYIDGDGVAVVEWADRLPGAFGDAVKVTMEYIDEESRKITIEGMQ